MRGTDLKELWLDEPLGERRVTPEEMPLSVGGPGAAIVVPGCRAGEVRAHVALTDGGLSVRPAAGAGPDPIDGVEIGLESRDDRLVIVVRHGGVANQTRPPLSDGTAGGAPDAEGDRIPIEVVSYEPRVAKASRRAAAAPAWQRPACRSEGSS